MWKNVALPPLPIKILRFGPVFHLNHNKTWCALCFKRTTSLDSTASTNCFNNSQSCSYSNSKLCKRASFLLMASKFCAFQRVFIRRVRPLYTLNKTYCVKAAFSYFCAFKVRWKIKKTTMIMMNFQQQNSLNMINQYKHMWVVKIMTTRFYGWNSC